MCNYTRRHVGPDTQAASNHCFRNSINVFSHQATYRVIASSGTSNPDPGLEVKELGGMSKQHTFCSLHSAVQYRFTVAAATSAAQGEQVSTIFFLTFILLL